MIRAGPVAAFIAVAFSGLAAAQPGLLPAARAFREVAETSFGGTEQAVADAVARATALAAGVRPTLPPGDARDLQAQLGALEAARRADDRTRVALASAEAYRILVSSSDRSSKAPPEARLLDYARLRFKADMQAAPPRWDDAAAAVAYARARWTAIAPQVATGSLRVQIDGVLDDLDGAVAQRDPITAGQAVERLLDLTQQLEAYFVAL